MRGIRPWALSSSLAIWREAERVYDWDLWEEDDEDEAGGAGPRREDDGGYTSSSSDTDDEEDAANGGPSAPGTGPGAPRPDPLPQARRAQTPAQTKTPQAGGGPGAGRANTRAARPLDPVLVGRSMAVANFINATTEADPEWVHQLCGYLRNGFPKRGTNDNGRAPDLTKHRRVAVSGKFRAALESLHKPPGGATGILGRVKGSLAGRGWVGYFQVPKTTDLDRAIFNCKAINEAFVKPPRLQLCEIQLLLGLMRRFGNECWVATSDLRHFFWQITIPEADRRMFSVMVGGTAYELSALPMGWAWSPWVAQGIAMALAARAVRDAGWTVVPGEGAAGSPPPYFSVRDATDQVIAFVVVWYDNFLVLTGRQDHNTTLRGAIDRQMSLCKVVYKPTREKRNWDVTQGSGEYIGISFRHDAATDIFEWRHIPGNVSEWANAAVNIKNVMGLLDAARVLGILVWDATVRLGKPRGTEVARLASEIGARFAANRATGASNKGMTVRLDETQADALRKHWKELLENPWQRARHLKIDTVITAASDANLAMRAGIRLTSPARMWTWPVAGAVHINRLEFAAAMDTVWNIVRDTPMAPHTLIALAVDNTTALSWLTGRGSPDPDIERRREALEIELERRQSALFVSWVGTDTMPADALTRNREADLQLMNATDKQLQERARAYLTVMPMGGKSFDGVKRHRRE